MVDFRSAGHICRCTYMCIIVHMYVIKTYIHNIVYFIGYDPKGCAELNGKLVHTNKWIGTTEVAVLLRYIGIW